MHPSCRSHAPSAVLALAFYVGICVVGGACATGCGNRAIDEAREQRAELETLRADELAREQRARARAAAEEVAREAPTTAPPTTTAPSIPPASDVGGEAP